MDTPLLLFSSTDGVVGRNKVLRFGPTLHSALAREYNTCIVLQYLVERLLEHHHPRRYFEILASYGTKMSKKLYHR